MDKKSVSIIMGSASDMGLAKKAAEALDELGISYEVGIASAHRTPEDVQGFASRAHEGGIKVIIAIAGLSAALPGVVAAHTALPVIGVPVSGGLMGGLDALLSVAQMPPGVPVACCGVDGAKNAALMAARIISLADPEVADRYRKWSEKAAEQVRASRTKLEGLPQIEEY